MQWSNTSTVILSTTRDYASNSLNQNLFKLTRTVENEHWWDSQRTSESFKKVHKNYNIGPNILRSL